MTIPYLPKWPPSLILLVPPIWGNNHPESYCSTFYCFPFYILSSHLYVFLKTMVMISVAFKLTQKDIMYNGFRIFKFHIDKTHLCCTSFIILYFDCSMYPIGWICYNLFIHSFAHRHLGFSQVFDVVYGATITFVYIFPGAYVQEFLVHIYIKAKCWKCGRLTLWDNDRTSFPGSCANLLAVYEIFCLSTFPSTWYEQTFQFF